MEESDGYYDEDLEDDELDISFLQDESNE